MKVAFFDSGIGGLSVLNTAYNILPNESFVYFADTDNVPYGTKSQSEIKALVFDAVEFLSQFDLKALVLACNTATSVVVNELRAHYDFPIIGMEPAVKPATTQTTRKVIVCATERTLQEEKLDVLIENLNASDRIEKCSLQALVSYAEDFDFNNPELKMYLEKKFDNIDWNTFDSVVLGCTHFLFFKPHIQKIIPRHISILDGNEGTVKRLRSLISENTPVEQKSSTLFYQSKRQVPYIYFDHYLRYLNEI